MSEIKYPAENSFFKEGICFVHLQVSEAPLVKTFSGTSVSIRHNTQRQHLINCHVYSNCVRKHQEICMSPNTGASFYVTSYVGSSVNERENGACSFRLSIFPQNIQILSCLSCTYFSRFHKAYFLYCYSVLIFFLQFLLAVIKRQISDLRV